jgi:hypothetical protein
MIRTVTQADFDEAEELFRAIQSLSRDIRRAETLKEKQALISRRNALIEQRREVLQINN